ncbi:phosphatidate cytidylyltransferase [bacterium]|nr:phosphatidate cytidylyltransferase [bacterium]
MQHLYRWLTAIVLIPILLWILLKGSTAVLAVLISIVSLLAMREFLKIIFKNDNIKIPLSLNIISFVTCILLISCSFFVSPTNQFLIQFFIVILNFMALGVAVLSSYPDKQDLFNIISKQILGIVYIPVSLSLIVFIRASEHDYGSGALWILWLLIVVFSNDTGAFYGGKFFGKNALSPNISPNKTIEGSIGGIIVSTVVGFIFSAIFFRDFSLSSLLIPASLMLAIAGQAGDLFESALKRASGVKDSGAILPGHGGMLDRIDGLLPAIPVLYMYLTFII